MKSAQPKVMHKVAGLPMLGHVLAAAQAAGSDAIALVLAPGMTGVRDFAAAYGKVDVVEQAKRLGTAHAVLQARDALVTAKGDVLVLYGDTPLVTASTLKRLRRRLAAGADLVVLGFRPPDPRGYGRLVVEGRDRLVAIREEKDATAEEREIGLCNSGVMAFRGEHLPGLLEQIGRKNAQGEYYLTDAVELARAGGLDVRLLECAPDEVHGVNSREDLAQAEALCQARLRRQAMAAGVTMIDPATVFLSHDTKLGRDVLIEPNVYFAPGVRVDAGATIRANSHLEGAHVATGAVIGPFARLRPGAVIGKGAKVGNFVEVKNSDVAAGAKVNHLAYIGDADIGARANIGAGTITCNYDGLSKHVTRVGADAFIGSNSALVAPVSIGRRAYIGTGSVITFDVAADSLGIARARQAEKRGWARKFREKFSTRKAGKV